MLAAQMRIDRNFSSDTAVLHCFIQHVYIQKYPVQMETFIGNKEIIYLRNLGQPPLPC